MCAKVFADYPLSPPAHTGEDDPVAKTGPWWDWYKGYLASTCWSARRLAVLSRADGRCEECHAADATEVHHVTYARVGRERLGDLLGLCTTCHNGHHGVFTSVIRDLAEEILKGLYAQRAEDNFATFDR